MGEEGMWQRGLNHKSTDGRRLATVCNEKGWIGEDTATGEIVTNGVRSN